MKKLAVLGLLAAVFTVACSSTPKQEVVSGSAHPEERAPAADTDVDVLTENTSVRLEKCGGQDGYAYMRREGSALVVVAKKLDCAYRKTIFDDKEVKLDGSQNNFSLRLVVDENIPGWHQLEIGSKKYFNDRNAGSKADIIRFYVPPRLVQFNLFWGKQPDPQPLRGCGGEVEAKQNNGHVNFIIRDIKNCNMFDIVGSNGDSVDYDAKPIRNVGFGSNSFEIPRRLIEFGKNGIELRLYRAGSRQYGDRVLIKFNDWNQ